jgi:Skp family chaperone for outer membrane proteins
MKKWTSLAVATTAFLGFIALGSATAQQPAVKVGYIDMEGVFNRCDARKAGDEQMQALAGRLRERLSTLRDAALLPSNTWQSMRSLLEKDKLTDAEAAQLTAIKAQVTQFDDELKKLQQTTSPTDAQKARLNELQGNMTANAGNLQVAAGDYDKQIGKLQLDLRNQIVADIQKAAEVVCKQQGCLVILARAMAIAEDTSQLFVVAGGVDLTDAVVKQVNSARK